MKLTCARLMASSPPSSDSCSSPPASPSPSNDAPSTPLLYQLAKEAVEAIDIGDEYRRFAYLKAKYPMVEAMRGNARQELLAKILVQGIRSNVGMVFYEPSH